MADATLCKHWESSQSCLSLHKRGLIFPTSCLLLIFSAVWCHLVLLSGLPPQSSESLFAELGNQTGKLASIIYKLSVSFSQWKPERCPHWCWVRLSALQVLRAAGWVPKELYLVAEFMILRCLLLDAPWVNTRTCTSFPFWKEYSEDWASGCKGDRGSWQWSCLVNDQGFSVGGSYS